MLVIKKYSMTSIDKFTEAFSAFAGEADSTETLEYSCEHLCINDFDDEGFQEWFAQEMTKDEIVVDICCSIWSSDDIIAEY